MGMNKESNSYTLVFASILVIVVGTLLAFVSMSLKPIQKENVKNEKKQMILKTIGEFKTGDDPKAASAKFSAVVTRRIVLSYDGEVLSTNTGEIDQKNEKDAFNIDLLKEYRNIKDKSQRNYPLFVCEKEGETYYVVPVMGSGLWAAVWGYIGFDKDFNKIYGAVFDHKSETPGLGAEISQDWFGAMFTNDKYLTDASGNFVSVAVVKPGIPLDKNKVEGITGGTFTSVGVDEMIRRTTKVYFDFFKKNGSI